MSADAAQRFFQVGLEVAKLLGIGHPKDGDNFANRDYDLSGSDELFYDDGLSDSDDVNHNDDDLFFVGDGDQAIDLQPPVPVDEVVLPGVAGDVTTTDIPPLPTVPMTLLLPATEQPT